MSRHPKLSDGCRYGYDGGGKRICVGSHMGRPNVLPDDRSITLKLRMVPLRLVDGDYDRGGAYWGFTRGTAIYFAWVEDPLEEKTYQIFVRATSRQHAKHKIRELLPNARFYH